MTNANASSRGSRHRLSAPGSERSNDAQSRSLSAKGVSGEMRFYLQRVVGGLYVEREDIPRIGAQTQQALEFTTAHEFRQWCDNDPIRFEHPHLHVELKRRGEELWGLDEPSGESNRD